MSDNSNSLAGESLKNILGRAGGKLEKKFGIKTPLELLYFFPRRYHELGELTAFSGLILGEEQSVIAQISDSSRRRTRGGKWMLSLQLSDGETFMDAVFWAKSQHLINWMSSQLKVGQTKLFSGRPSLYRGRLQLSHPSYQEVEDENLDVASNQAAKVQAQRPEPIYPAKAGLPTWTTQKAIAVVLELLKSQPLDDPLPADIRVEQGLLELNTALEQIHRPQTRAQFEAARNRFRFEEAFVLQAALAQRRQELAEDAPILEEVSGGFTEQVASTLPFALTDSQQQALADIGQRIASARPMNVLLQGDVGSGKTVVSLLAMLRAIDGGRQGIFMAPTEVLVQQHFATLTNLLGKYAQPGGFTLRGGEGVPIYRLTSSMPAAEKRRTLDALKTGQPALIVGTHALLSNRVILTSPGVVVIDEQHKFGVRQRDRLRQAESGTPHLLVMTATPIPRSVAMTSFGDLDFMTLQGMPPGRAKVETFRVDTANRSWTARTWQRAAEEIKAGHRVFVVCPAINPGVQSEEGTTLLEDEDAAETTTAAEKEPLANVYDTVKQLQTLPVLDGIEIGMLHGQMDAEEKDRVMANFTNGKTPLLVSTTVIEVGVDVPQATMMVILDADRFGLAQLHQLRGRIGRGKFGGVCLVWSRAQPGTLASNRLDAFTKTTDGFELAAIDLQLRESGNVLGDSQSGRASSLKILDLLADEEVISQARKDAKHLVETDPQLQQHQVLQQAISRRISEEEQEFLERG